MCVFKKIRQSADLVQPIAMPNIADPSFPKLNQEGKIIGFGVINDTTMMNPSPNPTLKTVYLTVANCSGQFPGTDAVRNFCGHDDNPGATNLCRGDLGSAFVVTVRGRKVLVSWIMISVLNLLSVDCSVVC